MAHHELWVIEHMIESADRAAELKALMEHDTQSIEYRIEVNIDL